MTLATMQPPISLSPPLQVLFLQLFNMAVQNISRSAPVPGLGNVCVAERAELAAMRVTMEEMNEQLQDNYANQNKQAGIVISRIDELQDIIDKKFKVCDELRKEKEEQKNELTKILEQERKSRFQLEEKYQLYKDTVKRLIIGTGGINDKLLAAAKAGDTALVKVLVETGVDVDVRDVDGMTPLHLAAQFGDSGTVQALVDAGAEVDAKTKVGETALHLAARIGSVDTCKVLLAAGATINYKLATGYAPLHTAAYDNKVEVCRLFLDSGANIDELDVRFNNTALHWAAQLGYTGVVRLLLERGANRNLKDKNGNTPLDIARSGGHTDVVTALSTL